LKYKDFVPYNRFFGSRSGPMRGTSVTKITLLDRPPCGNGGKLDDKEAVCPINGASC
jgi:hypothetical protein